jgi:hypothetical protein
MAGLFFFAGGLRDKRINAGPAPRQHLVEQRYRQDPIVINSEYSFRDTARRMHRRHAPVARRAWLETMAAPTRYSRREYAGDAALGRVRS